MYLNVVRHREGTPIPWWGYAGIRWTNEQADLFILAGHVTPERVGHELTHPLEGEHHSVLSCWNCLRVFWGWRTWRHGGRVTPAMAAALIRDGTISVPTV